MTLRFPRGFERFSFPCVVAIAWLLPASAAFTAVPVNRLQSLVNDAATELELAYRQQPEEREHRRAQLISVLRSWREAPRSEANNERLATWLRAAIRNSMPGSREPLPATPKFVANVEDDSQPVGGTATKALPAAANTKPESDPFRDDPTSE